MTKATFISEFNAQFKEESASLTSQGEILLQIPTDRVEEAYTLTGDILDTDASDWDDLWTESYNCEDGYTKCIVNAAEYLK